MTHSHSLRGLISLSISLVETQMAITPTSTGFITDLCSRYPRKASINDLYLNPRVLRYLAEMSDSGELTEEASSVEVPEQESFLTISSSYTQL